jgi:hypothetical protein
MNGKLAISNHTSGLQGQQLRLSFEGARSQEVGAIFLHWTASRGTFGLFALPTEVWSGAADPAAFTPAGYLWKYADVPQVDEIPCGLHDVALELELVPINASAGFVDVPAKKIIARGVPPVISGMEPPVDVPVLATIARAPVPLLTSNVPTTGRIILRAPVPTVTGS